MIEIFRIKISRLAENMIFPLYFFLSFFFTSYQRALALWDSSLNKIPFTRLTLVYTNFLKKCRSRHKFLFITYLRLPEIFKTFKLEIVFSFPEDFGSIQYIVQAWFIYCIRKLPFSLAYHLECFEFQRFWSDSYVRPSMTINKLKCGLSFTAFYTVEC